MTEASPGLSNWSLLHPIHLRGPGSGWGLLEDNRCDGDLFKGRRFPAGLGRHSVEDPVAELVDEAALFSGRDELGRRD